MNIQMYSQVYNKRSPLVQETIVFNKKFNSYEMFY